MGAKKESFVSLLQSIFVFFIIPILSLVFWLIIIEVIFSWLVAFNILNLNNPTMRQIYHAIRALTRPILEPIRRILPNFGGMDFSPLIAILLIDWLRRFVVPSLMSNLA